MFEFINFIINFIKINFLSIIWLIFIALFLFMAWREWRKAMANLESLESLKPLSAGKVEILGINFTEMLNKFKNELNQSNKESHKLAATSYFLAGLTALVSFIISLL
ncbi:hypothetical protein KJ671_02905 [Patescibacteria group bacterium]|nr:hypothetical protein [Patescibacteria group bacterium]